MKRIVILILLLAAAGSIAFAGPADAGNTSGAILEINCTGLEKDDRALYNVYGPGGRKIYSVALQGSAPDDSVSRRISGLEPGLYRVAPAGWDWTYEDFPAFLVLPLVPGRTTVFNFTASKRTGLKSSYEEGKLNRFDTL